MLGIPVDDTIILQEPFRLVQAFFIMCGFYLLNYLTDAIYYEVKYGMGEDFFNYGRKYVKEKIKGYNNHSEELQHTHNWGGMNNGNIKRDTIIRK